MPTAKRLAIYLAVLFAVAIAGASMRPKQSKADRVAAMERSVCNVGQRDIGHGSGVVIDHRGYILTAYHVVDTYESPITVEFNQDGIFWPARLVREDTVSDLAIVKVDRECSDVAPWGSSTSLRPGDKVYTIGFPYQLRRMVGCGIVSTIDEKFEIGIQAITTDAGAHPGDSGGAMFDKRGRLVGIITAQFNPHGWGNIGINYVVPGDVAKTFAKETILPEFSLW